jgi:hypothetical protein
VSPQKYDNCENDLKKHGDRLRQVAIDLAHEDKSESQEEDNP